MNRVAGVGLGVGRTELSSSSVTAHRKHRPDYWLLIVTLTLLSIGLTVIYSISPALSELRGGNYVLRQIIAILLGVAAFVFTAKVPLKQWQKWQWALLIIAALGTIVALITPVVPEYPQHRWIRLGTLSLQSVEVLKFALLIAVSGFLAARAKANEVSNMQKTLKPLIIGLAIIGLIVAFIQSDLGSTGVITVMIAAMAYIAGLPMRKLLVVGFIIIVVAVLAVMSTPYRRARVATYLNPESNCQTDAGHQACQALIAVGSGGVVGLGLGKSVQAYGYLPEAQNDSIFAIYAEKFGFIGSIVLLALFGVLFSRLRRIAERAPDMFSKLVVSGVLAWLSTQSIINIGAMLGLLPLKGITLPLISYGGTSVLFVGAALGLVFQVSQYTSFVGTRAPKANNKGSEYEDSNDRRRIRGAYHPDSGRRA